MRYMGNYITKKISDNYFILWSGEFIDLLSGSTFVHSLNLKLKYCQFLNKMLLTLTNAPGGAQR